MTLISRISRLFRADFHAVLDSLEEPDVLLRQAIREMEDALELDEQSERRRATDLERLNARRGELDISLTAIAEELDICFSANQEPLARNLIKRRLETERLQERLAQQTQTLEKSLTELRTRLQDQQQRLEALRQKSALFAEEQYASYASGDRQSTQSPVDDDAIEIALLREKQRRMSS